MALDLPGREQFWSIFPDIFLQLESKGKTEQSRTVEVGRRVVDLSLFLEKLKEGCHSCGSPLDGTVIHQERIYGLASLLSIPCPKCRKMNKIPTGKQHRAEQERGLAPFDVNNLRRLL